MIAGPSSTLSWSGSMVASGTATVTYTDANGQQQTLSNGVSVPRRAVSWASVVGGSTGQPGDIDVCIQEDWDGLTASKLCTSSSDAAQFFIPRVAELSSSNGLTVAQVGSTGPNAGLYYVNQMSAYMDLRTQISPRYRTNGPAYTLAFAPATLVSACAAASVYGSASVYQANAVCTSNLSHFNNLVSCVWSHEARHLTAGIGAAQYITNDVYVKWEPLVRANSTALVATATDEYGNVRFRVYGIVDAAHSTGPYLFMVGCVSISTWAGETTTTNAAEMLKPSSRLPLVLFLLCLPTETSAQSAVSQSAQALSLASRIARSIRTDGNDGRALPILTQARKQESRALMDEIADTLAAIAIEPSVDDVANTRARAVAIGFLHLAGIGESGLPGGVNGTPYSGAAPRLRRITDASPYVDVRQLALKRLSNLDRTPAFLIYLRQQALSPSFVAVTAVEILADERGTEGRTIARELYRSKALRNAAAERVLSTRARMHGW